MSAPLPDPPVPHVADQTQTIDGTFTLSDLVEDLHNEARTDTAIPATATYLPRPDGETRKRSARRPPARMRPRWRVHFLSRPVLGITLLISLATAAALYGPKPNAARNDGASEQPTQVATGPEKPRTLHTVTRLTKTTTPGTNPPEGKQRTRKQSPGGDASSQLPTRETSQGSSQATGNTQTAPKPDASSGPSPTTTRPKPSKPAPAQTNPTPTTPTPTTPAPATTTPAVEAPSPTPAASTGSVDSCDPVNETC